MGTVVFLIAACLISVPVLYHFDDQGLNGLIPLIKEQFAINDSQTAVIRTTISIANTGTLALIWLFGDMFKRRKLFLTCTVIWIVLSLLTVLLGSNSFLVFVALRALSSIPSAVFEVLAPVILADLFEDRALGIALTCLYLIQTLFGLASITVSSWIVTSGLPWQSTLIAVPLVALMPLIFLVCSAKTLKRVEKTDESIAKNFSGVFSILSIRSYVLLTATLAISDFHNKGYNFWFPSMYLIIYENVPEVIFGLAFPSITTINTVSMVVGMAGGFMPVMWLAQSWRHGTGLFSGRGANLRAYPIIVTIGSTLTSAMFVVTLLLLDHSYIACVVVTFFVGFASAADRSLTQQMILMVVPSNHRAAAVALYRLLSAMIAIPSAQIIGMATDLFRGDSAMPLDRFSAFQKAMLCESSLLIISSICYIAVVFLFPGDFKRAERAEDNEEKKYLLGKSNQRSESVEHARTSTFYDDGSNKDNAIC